ncbi:MAG TPA: valine--tRNA ligase, partial [Nitrospiria bacterium]
NNTLQDILTRWKRMEGFSALWVPGTDHAGIATQNVVERQLMAEKTDRETLGREAFVQRVWKWREESGRTIIAQLKRLGASCDWGRERFTMDRGLSQAVREVFVRLFEEGLIYRGERLINWCPRCETALSDIEVEHEDAAGTMFHIRYPLADEPEKALTVATTRPETMLGDSAVAVHPDDPRFNPWIGKMIRLPLTTRTIPVVGDAVLVDREFGTGAVKITPAHDFNDEKAGQRHGLPRISLLDEKGRVIPDLDGVDPGLRKRIAGLSAPEARKVIVSLLQEEGFLTRTEDHKHAVGKCYRCKTVVEPYLSPQWFVQVDKTGQSLAQPAVEAVRQGRIRLIPEAWQNNFYGWMENIQDWCISRQIWWGHQLPAWYCQDCNPITTPHDGGTPIIPKDARPIVARTDPSTCPECGGGNLIRDPDVLDTWFSSALWPFSTLGWPEKTDDLQAFYPTSALVTSFDILFFWVARMIMMGLKFMGEVPFRDVYIHALVRDADGQKMSKSKGNVIDPLVIMEKYGTDALRFTLASMASPGRDIRLSEDRIEGYRNFANKIWNAARFIHMQAGDNPRLRSDPPGASDSSLTLSDRWILTRLAEVQESTRKALSAYRFDEASRTLYQFAWSEFCDWYLELSKPILGDPEHPGRDRTLTTMIQTFEALLRLLHPFMPFISEEIWQTLPGLGERGLSISGVPFVEGEGTAFRDPGSRDRITDMMEIVTRLRGTRAELGLSPTRPLSVVIQTLDAEQGAALTSGEAFTQIARLGRIENLEASADTTRPPGSVLVPCDRVRSLWVKLKGVIDPEKETARLNAELKKISTQVEKLGVKLKNPAFLQKAPAEIRRKDEARLEELKDQKARIENQLENIKELEK